MLSRRSLLAVAGGHLLLSTLPEPVFAAGDSESFAAFLALSEALTGYDKAILDPPLDPMHLARHLFLFSRDNIGPATFDRLLSVYARIARLPPRRQEAAIATDIMGNERLGTPARQIIKLWYTGQWYAADGQVSVLSADSYTRGLMWQAIGAHPMGDSVTAFGAWSVAPPQARRG